MSLCASVYMFFVVTCWERADLLALVCGIYCEFVTFPLVSWVRCGTRLYRFLIFAPLLTYHQCTYVPNEYTRLEERHFMMRYGNQHGCKVCGSIRPRVRKQTSLYCLECDTPLCIDPCFELLHTYKDFKRAREIL